MKVSDGRNLWWKTWGSLAVLKLKVMLAVKTCLSIRPVSFFTKSDVEVYQLANNAGIMLYSEHKRSKKRLKTQ